MEAENELATIHEIVVSGRTFVPVQNTTFEQDLYIMDLMRRANMESLPTNLTDKAEISEVGKQVLINAYKSGVLFLLVGSILVEQGSTWNVQDAELNAAFFANLDTPEDKQALHGAIVGLVLGFFIGEGGSLPTSRKSSIRPKSVSGPPPPPKKRGVRTTSRNGQ